MDRKILRKAELFHDMTEEEIVSALSSLQAEERSSSKGQMLLRAGNVTRRMGLVLEGSVTIESNDAWGNRSILSHVGPLQCFAESYALLEGEALLVDVVANEDCKVLFLWLGAMRELAEGGNPWGMKFFANLLTISAHKNLVLSGRSFHTAPKTVRGRVMAYLNSMALQKHSQEFDVPFDRQQMADYLNLERTALSKELGKMQRDGLILVRRRHFRILV